MPASRAARLVVAALLVASAALFGVGVIIERGAAGSHVETAATPEATSSPLRSVSPAATRTIAPHNESGESAAHIAAEHGAKTPQATVGPAVASESKHTESAGETIQHQRAELAQRIFGINAEATSTVVVILVFSALLALLIAAGSSPIVLLIVAAFAAVSAVFDWAEVVHQLADHRTNLVVLAAAVLILHFCALAGSLVLLRKGPRAA